MLITLLGTGTPNLNVDQWGPSTIIQVGEIYLLFDCGRGTLLRIKQAGINPNLVSKIFLTHLHSDHIVGIPDLWLTGLEMGRDETLQIWGPDGTKSLAYHIKEAFKADVNGRQLAPQCLPEASSGIEATDIHEEVIDLGEDLKVTSFLVDHGSFKPALGFRVDYRNVSVVLSGDTRFSDNLVEHSKGADIIIHDAWVASEDSAAFQLVASPEEAAKVFNLVKPRLAVISHYNTEEGLHGRIRTLYEGPLLVGKDLQRITLTENGRVNFNDQT